MACPQCQQENPPGSNFCLGCGTRITPRCSSCGTDLPTGSRFRNKCGHPVTHASPMVRQDYEDEQHLERHRGHGEEVHGDQAPEVVVEKGAPGLRRWPAMADHVLG